MKLGYSGIFFKIRTWKAYRRGEGCLEGVEKLPSEAPQRPPSVTSANVISQILDSCLSSKDTSKWRRE